jgi:hypothetical protein
MSLEDEKDSMATVSPFPAPRRRLDRRRATESTRRYRARLAANTVVAPVEVGLEIIAMLIDLEWLPMSESESRRAIGLAIAALLRDAAGRR